MVERKPRHPQTQTLPRRRQRSICTNFITMYHIIPGNMAFCESAQVRIGALTGGLMIANGVICDLKKADWVLLQKFLEGLWLRKDTGRCCPDSRRHQLYRRAWNQIGPKASPPLGLHCNASLSSCSSGRKRSERRKEGDESREEMPSPRRARRLPSLLSGEQKDPIGKRQDRQTTFSALTF